MDKLWSDDDKPTKIRAGDDTSVMKGSVEVDVDYRGSVRSRCSLQNFDSNKRGNKKKRNSKSDKIVRNPDNTFDL